MNKLLTAYESACIFVELSPGPDKLLDEAVARLHEIDSIIKKLDKERTEGKCINCDSLCGSREPTEEIKSLEDENESIAKHRDQLQREIESGEGVIREFKEKLHDQVNTVTLKELDVFLTHTKKICKLKTEILVLKKKEGN